MKGKIFLVQWDAVLALKRADELKSDGWGVELDTEDGGRAYKRIKAELPDVVLIDISRRPLHGCEVYHSLRSGRTTRNLHIVFLYMDEKTRETIRVKAPDAIFTTPTDLNNILCKFAKAEAGA
jgi:CheY-like chemotaxis protein